MVERKHPDEVRWRVWVSNDLIQWHISRHEIPVVVMKAHPRRHGKRDVFRCGDVVQVREDVA